MSSTKPRTVFFPRFGRKADRLPAELAHTAGKCTSFENIETLEQRVLLSGDHPSLPGGGFDINNPPPATVIDIDAGTGIGTLSGALVTGTLTAGDDDLFKFTTPTFTNGTDFITIATDATNPAAGSTLDAMVEIYAADGSLVASAQGNGTLTGGAPTDGWVGFVADADTDYFVRVKADTTADTATNTGDYIVRVDALTTNGLLDANGELDATGSVDYLGDDEVFRIDTGSADAFDSLATAQGNAANLDTRLDLYDSTGTLIAADSSAGVLTDSFAIWRSDKDSTFFVRVRSDLFKQGTANSTGSFQLQIRTQATDYAINPTTRLGQIGGTAGGTDTAMFVFQAEGSGIAIIASQFASPMAPVDTDIRVFDFAGNQLRFNDGGLFPEVEIPVIGGDKYFIVIEGFDSFSAGFVLFAETHHNFDNFTGFDDHIDTPDLTNLPNDLLTIRQQAELATPIIWGDPVLAQVQGEFGPMDVLDHEFVVTGMATGRLHNDNTANGDNDLFVFTPPVDVIGAWPGQDDGGDPLDWLPNFRPRERLSIVLGAAFGGLENTFITIYDSNFEVLYTNDTISTIFPDPSGSYDPALLAPDPEGQGLIPQGTIGIEVFGGEVYFLEVSATGTGRYALAISTQGVTTDTDGDGVRTGQISTYFEPAGEGQWASARGLNISQFSGDSSQFVGALTSGAGFPGPQFLAWDNRNSGDIDGDGEDDFDFDVAENGEFAQIEDIGDVDLYVFTAERTGAAEIRINTTNIADAHNEAIRDNTVEFPAWADDVKTKADVHSGANVISSFLDSTLRIFNNDKQQIAYNRTNQAISGSFDVTNVGNFVNRTFFKRDARVTFDVQAGQTYFVQVESGQNWSIGQPADPANRTANTNIDWRYATGSYELLVNTISPDLDPGDPGQDNADDHSPFSNLASTIAIDDASGIGSITGIIANTNTNPAIPQDFDLFEFITPVTGEMNITVTAIANSSLLAEVLILDSNLTIVSQGLAFPTGTITLPLSVIQGDRFFVQVSGNAGTEGGYTIDVTAPAFADDHADALDWSNATPINILDFLGSAFETGNIEHAGDTDLFTFTAVDYDQVTLTVDAVDATLDPFVRVFEIGKDGNSNNVQLQIGFNDNTTTSTGNNSELIFSVSKDLSYFIVVSGQNINQHFGKYELRLELVPTDDHPDAGEFDLASLIVIDPSQGVGTRNGTIETTADTDLFRFISPSFGKATVSASADLTSPVGQRTRTSITLFDVNGVQIATATAGDSPFPTVQIEFDVDEGQSYFVLIAGVGDGSSPFTVPTGKYTVNLDTPLDDHANAGEFTSATTIPLNQDTGDGLGTGNIEQGLDDDLFTFTALDAGTITLSLGSGFDAPRMRVFDAAFNVISDTTALNGVFTVAASFSAANANDRFYILISPSSSSSVNTGSFTITVDGPPTPGDNTIDDDHADAGQFELATDLTSLLSTDTGNGQLDALIETAGDSDIFSFTSLADGRAFVQAVTPAGQLLDAGIRIFDASRNIIATDLVGVPGVNADTTFTITSTGESFFIEVFGISQATGAYTLRIDTEPVTHSIVYPEGFASSSISEFVSIANPNDFATNYTVILRYAKGERDVVVRTGTLAAGSRGGVAIANGKGSFAPGVRVGEAYSLVVESDAPLGATLAHYDFGTAVGESFTSDNSTLWTFPRVVRQPGDINDFIVVYNPNNTDSLVTLTAITPDGNTVTLSRIVGALRRGGWNINASSTLPLGTMAVSITSEPANNGDAHVGVVAALSHYDTIQGFGIGELGAPDGGATKGVIASLTNGDSITGQLSIFNPSTTNNAFVTLTGKYINTPLPDLVRSFTIAPNTTLTLTGDELNLVANQAAGLTYSSNLPVAVTASEIQGGDANATRASTEAAKTWFFGDAFINTNNAGTLYQETLSFFNPASSQDTTATVTLLFSDKTSASFTVDIKANSFAQVLLHERPEILSRPGNNFFSIQVDAVIPITSLMTHYDLFLAGGWSATGAPLGLTTPISTI